MGNFVGVTKISGNPVTAAGVNADRLDVLVNAGDYATSTGAASAYALTLDAQIVGYLAGMVVKFKANHTNTTSATLDVNSMGPQIIKKPNGDNLIANDILSGAIILLIYDGTDFIFVGAGGNTPTTRVFTAGETINGGTLPVPVFYNSSTSRVQACDANDTAKLDFLGFAVTNSTDGNPINVVLEGVVEGFSGLTIDADYYVSNTVGTIQTTHGDYSILVGRAISASAILVTRLEDSPRIYVTPTSDVVTGAGGTKVGTFTFPTTKKARFMQFDFTIFPIMTTSGSSSVARTYYDCWVDLAAGRWSARSHQRTSYNSGLSPYVELGGTFVYGPRGSNVFPLSHTDGGVTSRIDSIVAVNNLVTINYTLNTAGIGLGSNGSGIGISNVMTF